MTGFSDELLRAALADAAGTVRQEELRPLPAPPRRRRPLFPPLAALTAAAVAVAAVVAVVLVAPWSGHGRDGARPPFALAAYGGADYVLDGAQPPGGPSVTIRSTDTGRAIATLPAPAGTSGFRYSADSGDNRTFVLTTADPQACTIGFYRLTLGADGRPEGPLTEMRGTGLRQRTSEALAPLAVAPGARRIAYAGRECGGDSARGTVTVIDTVTGDRRVTRLPLPAFASDLYWAPNGRELVFQTMGEYLDRGLSTLDTSTGKVSAIRLGAGDTTLRGAAFGKDGTHIVALVRDGGQNHVVWYALATKTITRRVALPPSDPLAPTMFQVSGDRVVAMIGDHVHVVTGTKVTTHRAGEGGDSLP